MEAKEEELPDRCESVFYALLVLTGGLIGAYALRICGTLATA